MGIAEKKKKVACKRCMAKKKKKIGGSQVKTKKEQSFAQWS